VKPRGVHRQQGFTLIEALVVVVMIGVMLALAAPSFVTYTASQKVKTASFDLYATLVFARSEAIKRRQPVTVTPVSSDWKNGWTVSTVVGGVDTTLRSQDSLSGVVTAGATSVAYRLDGRLTGGTVGVLIGPEKPDASISNRCIRVDLTGLPKTTTSGTCP
jgi:type IV fimbrial biogenesis protein FimT